MTDLTRRTAAELSRALTSGEVSAVDVTRPDEPRPGLTADEALAGAPASELQRFSVPRILEED